LIAAYLVEAFPAKVRYTSVSLPYQIGNGVFDLARGCTDKDRCVVPCCAFAGPGFSGIMDEWAEGHV